MRVGPVPHKFWIFSVFNIYLRKKYPTPETNWILYGDTCSIFWFFFFISISYNWLLDRMNIYPRWLGGYPENNQGHAGKYMYGTH